MDPYLEEAPSTDSRRLSVISHLGGLAPLVGIPGFVVPLVVWLMERGKDLNVERQALEALNFQISMGIYTFILVFLIGALWIVAVGLLFIPVLLVLLIARIVLSIIGAVNANEGRFFRYPLTLRLV